MQHHTNQLFDCLRITSFIPETGKQAKCSKSFNPCLVFLQRLCQKQCIDALIDVLIYLDLTSLLTHCIDQISAVMCKSVLIS